MQRVWLRSHQARSARWSRLIRHRGSAHCTQAGASDLPAPDGQSGAGGTPQKQSSSGEKDAYAIPMGGFKPHYVPLMAGVMRIMAALIVPGTYSRRFHAPFEDYLGKTTAVALSMIVGGIALWALGWFIVRMKWHETRIGVAGIVVFCLGLILGLHFV